MAILVGRRAERFTSLSADGWNLEALRLHHGAAAAYQVTRRDGRVRVDARSAEGTCVIERRRNDASAFPGVPRYEASGSTEISAGLADKICVGRNSGGAEMDINSVSRTSTLPLRRRHAIPVEKAAENREVVQAIKAVNGTEMFGQDNQLMFQRDPESQRMVVRVVNRKTNEVVSQIPAEYVLRLAEELEATSLRQG